MIKMYMALLLLFMISSYNCKESVTNPSVESELKTITGKIKDYDLTGDVILKLMHKTYYMVDSVGPLDSTKIKSDGSFTAHLTNPPDKLLYTKGFGQLGVTYSNSSSKMYGQCGFYLYRDTQAFGQIYSAKRSGPGNYYQVGDHSSYLMYSQDYLKVGGQLKSDAADISEIDKYDVTLLKGWNVITYTVIEHTDSTFIREVKASNSFPGEWIMWHY